ncbi:MAG TPA: SOS response-associated peptidase [Oscillatoriaceae cyanobacterium]
MCGRYSLIKSLGVREADRLGLLGWAQLKLPMPDLSRYNIAPTQQALIVREHDGRRELVQARWGLIPGWTKDPKAGPTLINTRSETIAEKPTFKNALKRRRCLVPADGFYEWAPLPEGAKKTEKKQPWWFRRADEEPFAFAGLWESWTPPEGPAIESFTIITTTANDLIAPIHDRMPVILPESAYATWLDTDIQEPEAVLPLLVPYPAECMKSQPVSKRLNSTRGEDDPSLILPDDQPAGQLKLF